VSRNCEDLGNDVLAIAAQPFVAARAAAPA